MTSDRRGYRRDSGIHPANACVSYVSTHKRAPAQAPIRIDHTLSEITGPRFDPKTLRPGDDDMTRFDGGDAIGERIIVAGRVIDEDDRPVAHTMIELWQANAAGRYAHPDDRHEAPLDPHFSGIGRVFTDAHGAYRFTTIKPGAYPWRNHHNAWRPQHIHFSVFGAGFAARLVTQMYFPGDPLLALDPIFNSVSDAGARERLIASFDLETTLPDRSLGYRFDIVLRGRDSTPMEP